MNLKNLIMWVIIVLLSVGLFNMFQDPNKINSEKSSLAFSNFLNEVDAGRVVEVQIQGNNISGVLADGKTFKTYSPNYPELVDKLLTPRVRKLFPAEIIFSANNSTVFSSKLISRDNPLIFASSLYISIYSNAFLK